MHSVSLTILSIRRNVLKSRLQRRERQNRELVLDILTRIHVPGEIVGNAVYVYGYRTDVDYIKG